MMLITRSVYAAACLFISILPNVTAFYPYRPKYGNDNYDANIQQQAQRSTPKPTNLDRRSITLPVRRVPVRRDNKYSIVKSRDPVQKNSVAIDQDGPDFSYMVAVTIGSSKEEYHLLLDSAASNTWVMGQECKDLACGTHNLFGHQDSDTLKTDDTSFSISFGTGTVSGTIATDIIHIASLSVPLFFGLATNVSDEFRSYPMDGIIGIGRGDNVPGTVEHPQLMDVLTTSKLIPAKLYGIHLSRGKDGLNNGELNFGKPNTDRYDGNLEYVSTVVNNNGYWEIEVVDAGFDGKTLGITGRSAILDSGTSYILMPENDAVALHKLIPGYNQSGETFTVPCDTRSPIQIKFGHQAYDISTADFIGQNFGDGNCASNVVGRQVFGNTQWLVGDVFLKNVYSVFDSDNGQVGFGVKAIERPISSASSGTPAATASNAASTGAVSATTNPILLPSGSSIPTAATPSSPGASEAKTGDAGRVTVPSSSFALGVALVLRSVLF